jgi:hypothetical protein
MSRLARLAAAKGGKTRAILKLAGRGAILLTMSTFNLAMWMFWAILTVFGFVASLKRTTERTTERYCVYRRRRRARRRQREERERCARALAASADEREEPTVIFSTAPGVVAMPVAANLPAPRPRDADRVVGQRLPWPAPSARRQESGHREFGHRVEPLESTVRSFRDAQKARAGRS